EADELEAGLKRHAMNVGLYEGTRNTLSRVLQTIRKEIHADHEPSATNLFQDAKSVPGAAAYFKDTIAVGPVDCQAGYHRSDDFVPRTKPEMTILDLEEVAEEAGIITLRQRPSRTVRSETACCHNETPE